MSAQAMKENDYQWITASTRGRIQDLRSQLFS